MKKILITLAVIVIGITACDQQSTDEPKNNNATNINSAEKAVINTVIQASELDVSALSGTTEKLKAACAKNKYGLSEDDCIQTIEKRKDLCIQQTAQKFPGQLSNVDRMQEVVSNHLDCLFQK